MGTVKELRKAPGLSPTEFLGQPKQLKFPIILEASCFGFYGHQQQVFYKNAGLA